MMTSQNTLPGNWARPAWFGLGVVAVTFGVFGVWSGFAELDSAVLASGKVAVETERKVVQHLEGGIVREIVAHADQRVREGDVIIRIDPTQAEAGAGINRNQLTTALAEEARLDAEAKLSETVTFPQELGDGAEARRVRSDQRRQFDERRAARLGETKILRERIAQSEQQVNGLRAQSAATKSQIKSITDELAKLKPLLDKGLVPVTRINPLERSRTEQEGRLGAIDSDIARLERQMSETRLQIEQVDRKTVEEASVKLSEVRDRIADLREKVRVSEDVLARSEVRAPRSGRVVNVKVHTVGAVVRPGDVLMEIVPEDDDFVVSARLSPIDITHIHQGLVAEVRLPSFKARTTPVALGEVASVSADVLRDEMTLQPYYDLKVSVRASSFPAKVRDQLVAGMPAEVIVSTGERTVLAYLTQPLADAMRRGMREH